MAWTQADIDALEAAIIERKGVRALTLSDQTYQFESSKEMLELLSVIKASVNGGSRTRYAATRKGV